MRMYICMHVKTISISSLSGVSKEWTSWLPDMMRNDSNIRGTCSVDVLECSLKKSRAWTPKQANKNNQNSNISQAQSSCRYVLYISKKQAGTQVLFQLVHLGDPTLGMAQLQQKKDLCNLMQYYCIETPLGGVSRCFWPLGHYPCHVGMNFMILRFCWLPVWLDPLSLHRVLPQPPSSMVPFCCFDFVYML